jgi:hypothetical protein
MVSHFFERASYVPERGVKDKLKCLGKIGGRYFVVDSPGKGCQ